MERIKIHYYANLSIVDINVKRLVPCCRKCVDWAKYQRHANQSHNSFLKFLVSSVGLCLRGEKHTYCNKSTASYTEWLYETC